MSCSCIFAKLQNHSLNIRMRIEKNLLFPPTVTIQQTKAAKHGHNTYWTSVILWDISSVCVFFLLLCVFFLCSSFTSIIWNVSQEYMNQTKKSNKNGENIVKYEYTYKKVNEKSFFFLRPAFIRRPILTQYTHTHTDGRTKSLIRQRQKFKIKMLCVNYRKESAQFKQHKWSLSVSMIHGIGDDCDHRTEI